jgi:hypothetical protein
LIDEAHRIRVDVFQALGNTVARAHSPSAATGGLAVLSVEDLVARSTALVCGRLQRGLTIDVKHVTAFNRLRGLGAAATLSHAWSDHRQQVTGTLAEASDEAVRLLEARPELIVVDRYSSDPVACEQCRQSGPFRPAPSNRVVEILGYC